jgi:hypothetical protein
MSVREVGSNLAVRHSKKWYAYIIAYIDCRTIDGSQYTQQHRSFGILTYLNDDSILCNDPFTPCFLKDMAPRRSLSPPKNSQARRRRRSADDRLGSLASTPDESFPLRPTSSRSARKYEASEASTTDGEDGAYDTEDDAYSGSSDSEYASGPPHISPHTPTRSGVPSFSLSNSERSSLPQTPTTPINHNRTPIRHAATDPGDPRTSNLDGSSRTPTLHPHRYSSPCGRKSYVRSGAWLEKHKSKCVGCVEHQLEELQELTEEEYLVEMARKEQVETGKTLTYTHRVGQAEQAERRWKGSKSTRIQTDEGSDDVSAKDIDANLIEEICKKLPPNEKDGWVYLVHNPEQEGLYKIGYAMNVTKRKHALEWNCGIQVKTTDVWGKIECIKRTERLVHIDLDHRRRKWKCVKCGHTHGEWFEVDEDLAIATVDRWVTWMRRTPYNEDATLKRVWSELVGKMRRPEPRFANGDHEARFAHWKKALQPPTKEELKRIKGPDKQAEPDEQLVRQKDAGTNLQNMLQSMELRGKTGGNPTVIIERIYISNCTFSGTVILGSNSKHLQ